MHLKSIQAQSKLKNELFFNFFDPKVEPFGLKFVYFNIRKVIFKFQYFMGSTSRTFLSFLTGAAAGLLAGVLLAPKSGKETREMLSRKTKHLREELGDTFENGSHKIKEASDQAYTGAKEMLTRIL